MFQLNDYELEKEYSQRLMIDRQRAQQLNAIRKTNQSTKLSQSLSYYVQSWILVLLAIVLTAFIIDLVRSIPNISGVPVNTVWAIDEPPHLNRHMTMWSNVDIVRIIESDIDLQGVN